MNDLWGWFHQRENEYREKGDKQRMEMARYHREAFDLSETDPQGMLQMNKKGRDLAKILGEPWWVFLYEVWMGIAYETHLRDLQSGLQQCLHCVNEARKPTLKDHPWTIAAHNTLLACYVLIDPIGYSSAIRDCLRHLDKEISPGPSEHRYVMMVHNCTFLMALGELDEAEKLALRHQALFDLEPWGNEWYVLYPIMDMCWIGYHQQDWDKMKSYAEKGEELASTLENTQLDVVEAQLWQALAARKSGNESLAKRLFRTAANRAARLEKEPSPEHFDALAYFHEMGGDLDKALEVRDRQLGLLAEKGRFGCECETLIKRCELLARLDRLTSEDVKRAQEATRPLKNPKTYQERIQRLKTKVSS